MRPPSWGNRPTSLLRGTNCLYAKSPYAPECNPWPTREEWEVLLLLRGTIVAAYGNVETLLSEFSIKLSHYPEYYALRQKYPHRMKSKLTFIRAAFEIDPLDKYKQLANSFIEKFESTSDLRHMMAHARVEMAGRHTGIDFASYQQSSSPAQIDLRRSRYSYSELELEARRSVRLSRIARLFYNRLTEVLPLPPM